MPENGENIACFFSFPFFSQVNCCCCFVICPSVVITDANKFHFIAGYCIEDAM